MGKRIVCIAMALLMICCLASCSTSRGEPSKRPDAAEQGTPVYKTYAEYFANSKHLHPETDEHLRYALYDNFVEVIECISEADTIVIPDTYKGKPVISIDGGSFRNNTHLKHLTIGSNILRIGSGAFEGCTALSHVNMSSSVNEIEGSAFSNCAALTSIIIPPRVSTVPSNAFSGCSSLTKVVIESTDMLDEPAPESGRQPEEISRTLEGSSFSGCNNLAIMWIPADINVVSDSILGSSAKRKPLICGADATASAQFATNQRFDYMLVDRDDFDTQARLFEDVSLIERTKIGDTLKVGNFSVTLQDVKYYSQLGFASADDNQTIVAVTFDITQKTQIVQYFDGLNVKCTVSAPGRDNIIHEFNKLPLMLSPDVLNMGYPVGNIAPDTHLQGVIVLKVSNRFETISITFAGASQAFVI